MRTMAIPFTEETLGLIYSEARKKNLQPETLLRTWVLERAKSELESKHIRQNDVLDVLALPLKVGYILTATAAATVTALLDEFGA